MVTFMSRFMSPFDALLWHFAPTLFVFIIKSVSLIRVTEIREKQIGKMLPASVNLSFSCSFQMVRFKPAISQQTDN